MRTRLDPSTLIRYCARSLGTGGFAGTWTVGETAGMARGATILIVELPLVELIGRLGEPR